MANLVQKCSSALEKEWPNFFAYENLISPKLSPTRIFIPYSTSPGILPSLNILSYSCHQLLKKS